MDVVLVILMPITPLLTVELGAFISEIKLLKISIPFPDVIRIPPATEVAALFVISWILFEWIFALADNELAGWLDFNLAAQPPQYEAELSAPKFNLKPFPIPKEAARVGTVPRGKTRAKIKSGSSHYRGVTKVRHNRE